MTSQGIEPRQIAAARALRKMNRGTARTEELADMDLEAALRQHAQPRATPEHTSSPTPLTPEAPAARTDAGGEEGGKTPPASFVFLATTSVTGDPPSETRPRDRFVSRPYISISGDSVIIEASDHRFKNVRSKSVRYKTGKLGINKLTRESTRHFQG